MISSVGGRNAFPFVGAYNASKFGLEGMSESLRRELMIFGVDVIIVAPGNVATPIWDKAEAVDNTPFDNTPYAPALARFRRYAIENGRKGLAPQRIGEAVKTALTAAKPKEHAIRVAPDPIQNLMVATLPKRIADNMIARRLGLKRVGGPGDVPVFPNNAAFESDATTPPAPAGSQSSSLTRDRGFGAAAKFFQAKPSKSKGKGLGIPWIHSSESGLFNGLRRFQMKILHTPLGLAAPSASQCARFEPTSGQGTTNYDSHKGIVSKNCSAGTVRLLRLPPQTVVASRRRRVMRSGSKPNRPAYAGDHRYGEGFLVKGFGRRPFCDGRARAGAGARKPPKEETAGR